MESRSSSSGKGNAMGRRAFLRTASAAAAVAAAGPALGAVSGANDRIGIGLIGSGSRGMGHLGVFKHLSEQGANIRIAAVCDAYRPRLERAAAAFEAKAYMDYRELLADPDVDVVSIATPDHHHGVQAIDAVRAGKHVYCEKPVTHWRQFDITKRLAEEVPASGKVFLLGTQGMSDPAWHQMKRLVQDGVIGKPIHAECGYFRVGDWGERGMPIDDPDAKPGPDLDWEAFLGDSPQRPYDVSRFFRWRMYEDYAGGPCTDLYPHCLTPLLHILGVGMPDCAVATGGKFRYEEREVPDTFNMLIDYPEGVTVAVLGTQGNDFQGTGGRGAPGRVPLVRGWDGTLTLQGNEIVFVPAHESGKQEQRWPVEGGENMGEYLAHFLDCCRSGNTATHSPVDLAYRTQTALIMGYLSFREGRTMRFDAGAGRIV